MKKRLLHTGSRLTQEQKYENAIMLLHCEPTAQEKKTKKLADSVSREYADFCENNPNSTQEQRKAAYAEIHDRICGKKS